MHNSNLTSGALFSGIGGFCLGFESKGIKTKWAIDADIDATKTYSKNLNLVKVLAHDIRSVSVDSSAIEPVDILHAGFPCQSFSCAGDRKGFDDPRGLLFFQVIRLIEEFKDKKPPILVLENTPNLRYGQGGKWFMEIEKEIKRCGYWFRSTNACELDAFELTELPQKRNRLFMVAFSIKHFRNGKFEWPHEKNTQPKDLTKYIDFNGFVDDDTYYLKEENRYHDMISKTFTSDKVIYQLRKFLVRVKGEGVCPTLTANMGLGGHNVPFIFDSKGLRKLTEYECLKLQGFPDWFTFPDEVGRAKRYVQIGNSVSVPVAALIADSIHKKIESELQK